MSRMLLLLLSYVSTCSPLLVCLHLFVDGQTRVRAFCSKSLCLCFLEFPSATRVYNLLCLCAYRSHSQAFVSYVDTWHRFTHTCCIHMCLHLSTPFPFTYYYLAFPQSPHSHLSFLLFGPKIMSSATRC